MHTENKYIVYIFASVLLLILLGSVLYSEFRTKQKISPEILSMTRPVTVINGFIEKIEKDKITVSFGTNSQDPSPTQKSLLTFQVLDTTQITAYSISIPYNFTDIAGTQKNLTFQNLKKGQLIEIAGKDDLRTADIHNLTAQRIQILNSSNVLSGTVISNNGTKLHVKGKLHYIPTALTYLSGMKDQEYVVQIESDTEISYLPPVSPPTSIGQIPVQQKPIKYSPSDLKVNTIVIVFSETDIMEKTPIKAAYIKPIITDISQKTEVSPVLSP